MPFTDPLLGIELTSIHISKLRLSYVHCILYWYAEIHCVQRFGDFWKYKIFSKCT